MKKAVTTFLHKEYAVGVILFIAFVIAMLIANSPFNNLYQNLLNTKLTINFGTNSFGKPLLLWINDGLMALFFLTVGLEIKREFYEGSLSVPVKAFLPVVAAVGGMLVPALLYTLFNMHDEAAMGGWAIPAATDIAFALGVLSLLGNRVPYTLKTFLLALAIIDDIGAILIIAFFYTADINWLALKLALIPLLLLFVMNYLKVNKLSLYLLVGAVLWFLILKSGIHATVAGILLALFIPINNSSTFVTGYSPLRVLEIKLHPFVNFIVLPIFALANAGIVLNEISFDDVFHTVSIGIIVGLFIGKQIGVFAVSWIIVKLRLAELPDNTNWLQLYGVATLCGIGFTMSLFISGLAYNDHSSSILLSSRIGILIGSLLSAITGYTLLLLSKNK